MVISLPETLTSGDYFLTVSGKGSKVSFTNETIVDFNAKHLSLFIQTDKAIYKAGQTGEFIIISLWHRQDELLALSGVHHIHVNPTEMQCGKPVRADQSSLWGRPWVGGGVSENFLNFGFTWWLLSMIMACCIRYLLFLIYHLYTCSRYFLWDVLSCVSA